MTSKYGRLAVKQIWRGKCGEQFGKFGRLAASKFGRLAVRKYGQLAVEQIWRRKFGGKFGKFYNGFLRWILPRALRYLTYDFSIRETLKFKSNVSV